MGAVFTFPAPTTAIFCCSLCGRPIALHRANDRWLGCPPDQRRELLKEMPRPRVLKVRPWAIDVEEGTGS